MLRTFGAAIAAQAFSLDPEPSLDNIDDLLLSGLMREPFFLENNDQILIESKEIFRRSLDLSSDDIFRWKFDVPCADKYRMKICIKDHEGLKQSDFDNAGFRKIDLK